MRHALTVGLLLSASSALALPPASFKARADDVLAASVPATGSGTAAAVSADGQVIWAGAAGRADVAKGSALEPGSLFRFASITKQFTAALVLTLVDDGRLGLDDDLSKLLPAETPASWHKVTVRQLLNHSSGIPSYTGAPGFMVEATTSRPHSIQQLIDVTRDAPLDFAPGTDWRYNNTGYVLLSAIIEKATGKPWHVALRDRLTGPLGLRSIRCGCEPGPATVPGHKEQDTPAQAIDMSVPSGAGALVGNAEDLARWAAALHGGKILKPATYQAMIGETLLPNGRKVPYGFGLSTGEVRGLKTIEHSGGIFGFSTESLYAPEKKLFVAALSNSEGGESASIARRLLAEAAGTPFPAMTARPADLKALEPFFGLYKDESGERSFFPKDGKIFTRRSGSSVFEVFPAGGDRYFYGTASLSYFDLKRGPDGKPVMHFYPNGALKAVPATWSGPVPAEAAAIVVDAAQLQRLAGAYALGPAVLTVALGEKGLTGQLTGQGPIPLEAIGPSEFRTVGVDARLVFEEANGKIARLVLHQGGRTMTFQRQ